MEEGFNLCGLPLVSAYLLLGFLSAHCVSIATICHLFLSGFILIRHAAFYYCDVCYLAIVATKLKTHKSHLYD